jgi:hypothetical protein
LIVDAFRQHEPVFIGSAWICSNCGASQEQIEDFLPCNPVSIELDDKGLCYLEVGMTLDQATRLFEARFEHVVDWEPHRDPSAAKAPNGEPYIAYATGIAKREGSTVPLKAIDGRIPILVLMFYERMCRKRLGKHTTLYWRTKPELVENGRRKYIYCRMVMA